ncbi:MAG: DUF255 domain-containing protein [Planctomycetota bacterium]
MFQRARVGLLLAQSMIWAVIASSPESVGAIVTGQEPAAHDDDHSPKIRKPLPGPEEIAKLPPDGGPEFNRLIHEHSPYLLQHARNPVDWYPWGPEAFEKAEKEGKPVFLSVGYSTCHWCHVMEHESFENDAIAKVLNDHYICIKVDREERPDIDEIYMSATQAVTGRGGWPNSVWLTADARPWYAGTYFPPNDSGNRIGFRSLLLELHRVWKEQPDRVKGAADQLSDIIRSSASRDDFRLEGTLSASVTSDLITSFEERFDAERGGFGAAPKFPPHHNLLFLCEEIRRRPEEERAPLLRMLTKTLDAMAMGGIHDHVGGGFHRYSTDADWLLPHFEKMLYDNAMLARVYAEAFELTANAAYRRVAEDILDWTLRELSDEAGGFHSAYDADSEGEEGKFYLWSRAEILEVLGAEDGELYCRIFRIEPEGNFRDERSGELTGQNIPHRTQDWTALAESLETSPDSLRERANAWNLELRERRAERIWPALDDKVLTAWNGLHIAALARAGDVLDSDRYQSAARLAADFLLDSMRRDDGRLYRTYRRGAARLPAVLSDYAFLADGLLVLHRVSGEAKYLDAAKELTGVVLEDFRSPGGGFFSTADGHEELLARTKDPTDGALPAANGVLARVLVRLGQEEDGERFAEAARDVFRDFGGLMTSYPGAATSLILAYARYLDSGGSPISDEVSGSKADVAAVKSPVLAEVFVDRARLRSGEVLRFAVRITIDDGWHINAPEPRQDYLVPTRLGVSGVEGLAVELLEYPVPEDVKLSLDPAPLSVYEGSVWIAGRLRLGEVSPEDKLVFELAYQACDDQSCQLPAKLSLEVGPIEEGDEPRHEAIFRRLGLLE